MHDIYMDTKPDAMADFYFYYNRHGDFFITIQKKKKRQKVDGQTFWMEREYRTIKATLHLIKLMGSDLQFIRFGCNRLTATNTSCQSFHRQILIVLTSMQIYPTHIEIYFIKQQ